MLVTIPYHSNQIGLSALLVNIQTQLTGDDLIYIVDTSPDRSGLKIAKMYGGNKTITFVEVGTYTIYEAWNFGIDSMLENNQEGILILNDDVLLANTCINNLKRAHHLTDDLALVTATPSRGWISDTLDPNFNWYNTVTQPKDIIKTTWLRGFAFYLKKECIETVGKFNQEYKIWFGDTDYNLRLIGKIGCVSNEYIYHFANRSFNYDNPKIQAQINLDRQTFTRLHASQSDARVSQLP
jgi:hypothetical protein